MNRNTGVIFLLVVLCASFLLPLTSYGAFGFFGQHKSVKSIDGVIHIPVKDVNDGEAHYYLYKDSGNVVKFFLVKSGDGVIRAAFDACDVCFPAKKGYSQDGEFMICNNCGRRFHTSRINVEEGGCNPTPLDRQVVGADVVINVDDIVPGTRFF